MKNRKLCIKTLSKYCKVEWLPKLGTGKADFKGVMKLPLELSDGK